MERRYYTPREVASLLRVSPTTVMKMIHEDRLFAIHVSDRIYRVPVGAVTRLQAGDSRRVSASEATVEALTSLGEGVDEREPDAVGA